MWLFTTSEHLLCVGDISAEIKTEADIIDVNKWPCDDTPSTGMFAVSVCTAFALMFLSSYSAHQHK